MNSWLIIASCNLHCACVDVCYCSQKATLGHGAVPPHVIWAPWGCTPSTRTQGSAQTQRSDEQMPATEAVPWGQGYANESPGKETLWILQESSFLTGFTRGNNQGIWLRGQKTEEPTQNSSIPGSFANLNPPQDKTYKLPFLTQAVRKVSLWDLVATLSSRNAWTISKGIMFLLHGQNLRKDGSRLLFSGNNSIWYQSQNWSIIAPNFSENWILHHEFSLHR